MARVVWGQGPSHGTLQGKDPETGQKQSQEMRAGPVIFNFQSSVSTGRKTAPVAGPVALQDGVSQISARKFAHGRVCLAGCSGRAGRSRAVHPGAGSPSPEGPAPRSRRTSAPPSARDTLRRTGRSRRAAAGRAWAGAGRTGGARAAAAAAAASALHPLPGWCLRNCVPIY